MIESRENIGKRLKPRLVTLQALGVNSVEDFMHKCLTDLFYLESVVLRHGKKVEYRDLNNIHKQACDFLGFATNPYPQKLLLMSRDSLKSTMGRGLMIQEFLNACVNNFEKLFAVFTGLTELSEEHLQIITREVLSNQLLQAYFRGYIPSKASDADSWSKDKIRYKRVGIDIGSLKKSLTGKHYAGMWTDNLVNEQNYKTETLRDSTFRTWQAGESTIAEDAWELVSETPWEADDVSGRILDPDCKYDYRKIYRKSPARFLSNTGFAVFSCFARNKKGELNFPEKLNEAYLERKKRKMGTYLYMRMYEGQIISDENIRIKPSMINHFEQLPENYIRGMALDCSGTTHRQSSPTGMSIADWSQDGDLFIDYADKRKVIGTERLRWVADEVKRCKKEGRPIDFIYIEREKYGIEFQHILEDAELAAVVELDPNDLYIITTPLRGIPRDKRHEKLIPYYENSKIYSRRGLHKYENEVRTWYKGKETNVDIIDTLFLHIANKTLPQKMAIPLSDEEQMEDDFEKQIRNAKHNPLLERYKKEISARF